MSSTFALRVWNTLPQLQSEAGLLWDCQADREDGLSEMVLKALNGADKFDGGPDLRGWLRVILRNVKRNQCCKGYNKAATAAERAKREDGPRLSYVDPQEGYAAHLTDLCDPEGIMIAMETARAL